MDSDDITYSDELSDFNIDDIDLAPYLAEMDLMEREECPEDISSASSEKTAYSQEEEDPIDHDPQVYAGLDSLSKLFSSTEDEEDPVPSPSASEQAPFPFSTSSGECRTIDWTSELPLDVRGRVAQQLNSELQVPMLLLPYNSTTKVWGFFSLSDSRLYDLTIPQLDNHWLFGSSKGWLGAVSENTFDVVLVNAMTRSRIILPRLADGTTMDLVSKMAVSGDPSHSTSSEKCMVALIFSRERKNLGVWEFGEESGWTIIPVQRDLGPGWVPLTVENFHDVICRDRKIYALGRSYISIMEYNGNGIATEKQVRTPALIDDPSETYIVLSKSGDLLFVARYVHKYETVKRVRRNAGTYRFGVFRLKYDTVKGAAWTKTRNLGEESLFIGCNESLTLSTTAYSWLKPNCIYFTDDDHRRHQIHKQGYQNDNGVYSLKKKCVIERFKIRHSVSWWPRPAVWCQTVYGEFGMGSESM